MKDINKLSIYEAIDQISKEENEEEYLAQDVVIINSFDNNNYINAIKHIKTPDLSNTDIKIFIVAIVIIVSIFYLIYSISFLQNTFNSYEQIFISSTIEYLEPVHNNIIFKIFSFISTYTSNNSFILLITTLLYLYNKKTISFNFLILSYNFYFLNTILQLIFKTERPFWMKDSLLYNNIRECNLLYSFPCNNILLNTTVYYLFQCSKIKHKQIKLRKNIAIYLIWGLFFITTVITKVINYQYYLYQILLSLLVSLLYVIITNSSRVFIELTENKLIKGNYIRRLKIYIVFFCFVFNCIIITLLSNADNVHYTKSVEFISNIDACSFNIFNYVSLSFGNIRNLMNFSLYNGLVGTIFGLRMKRKKISIFKKTVLHLFSLVMSIAYLLLMHMIEVISDDYFIQYYVISMTSIMIFYLNSLVLCKY